MTTDPFTDAVRAEAWRRHPDPVDVETGEPVDDWGFEEQGRRDFQAGAEWARTHLAAQEPTDVEVLTERIAGKLCDPARHVAHWPLVGFDAYCGQCYALAESVLPVVDAEAAARATRRDEEKR